MKTPFLAFFFKLSLTLSLALFSFATTAQSLSKDKNIHYVFQDSIKRPWLAAAEVAGLNIMVNRYNLYARPDVDFSQISWDSWKENFAHGLEWDWNVFGVNFIGHPYQGSHYYNSARSLGLNYWESSAYTFMGSLTWEYLGETHYPSGNDIATTTLGGMFLGEVLYRFSDLIIKENTVGFERGVREFCGFLVDPIRGFNRLMTGKMKNFKRYPGYVKPYFDGRFSAGGNYYTKTLNSTPVNAGMLLDIELNYGDPFDGKTIAKRPFDIFAIEAWYKGTQDTLSKNHLSLYGYGNVLLKDISNLESEHQHSIGVFHLYDYLNSGVVEIGDMGFTTGILSKFRLSEKINLKTIAMIGPAAFAGSNSEVIDAHLHSDDPTDLRDYILGPAIKTKLETKLEMGKIGDLSIKYHRWDIFVASGPEGKETLQSFTFEYDIPVVHPFYLGARFHIYNRKAHYDNFDDVKKRSEELRVFATYRF